MTKRAFITGIGGQDGSYLAEMLLERGYEVHGLVRHSSVDNLVRIRPILDKITLHKGDMLDINSLDKAIIDAKPDEVYQLADQDNVRWSHNLPGYQRAITYHGAVNVMEIACRVNPAVRIFQPLSATMFDASTVPQDETTPFKPKSPYATAKASVCGMVQKLRKKQNVFVSCGIMYNHDSPRRGTGYLLQKICQQVREGEVKLQGDLDLKVDIGYAPEYMDAAWRMLQLNDPDDFVIATGLGYSIATLIAHAVCRVNKDILCSRGDAEEFPNEPTLIGNPAKANRVLDWRATTVGPMVIDKILEA
jgi:GDPmannose 4,6-dehydratase